MIVEITDPVILAEYGWKTFPTSVRAGEKLWAVWKADADRRQPQSEERRATVHYQNRANEG